MGYSPLAKPLVPLTIQSPGFLGLNTQNSGSVLPPGWATQLDNFIYDDAGRLAARKGSKQLNGTVIPSSPATEAIHEYIDASGNILRIFAADNKIYKEVSGTMTDISGSITTPTADNWQFVNFNGWCIGYQVGHAPVSLTTVGGTFINGGGTQFNGVAGLSAYGRLWTVLNSTLYHSDLLINNFTGGSSGTFDLSKFWPNGMDTAVAIAEFNGYLIVFGQNSTIVYESPDDITFMNIVEGIDGIGCIGRDTVQNVGKDLIFLSNAGLRTLGRTIQEKSMPLTDVSKNVRDDLIVTAKAETKMKSVYNSNDGFYIISMPVAGVSYVFDLKFPNEDGSLKVTKWDFGPDAMFYTQSNAFYMAITDGYLSTYTGFQDEADSAGANGSSYDIDFKGVWNDFGEEVSPMLKILKQVNILAAGTPASSATFKWAVDYSDVFYSVVLAFRQGAVQRYDGGSNWSVDVYSGAGSFESVRGNTSHAGQVVKIGLTATINQLSFALQRVSLLAKIGKIGL